MMAKTLAIIKPGFLDLMPQIIAWIEREGFTLETCAVPRLLERAEAEQLYAEHKEREHFQHLVDYMCSEACSALLVGDSVPGRDTVHAFRQLIGAEQSERGSETIRGRWGRSQRHNVIHASDSAESFERERAILFPTTQATASQ